MIDLRWAPFVNDDRLPVTEFSGIRWQWQTDSLNGKRMWFAINWLREDTGPMATQTVEASAERNARANAQANGHKSEAMGC